MSDEFTTKLIEFITRSLEHIERKRATCITGNFEEKYITGTYEEKKIEI